jgi:alpha-ribazole phosphatase/probable phosphoglycerate mutase
MDWAAVTRVVLIRHGEPEASARGRCYGKLDVGLSPLGREQAARVAVWLRDEPLDAVYASPRRRAVDTAFAIAGGRALGEPRIVAALREIDFGRFEGLTYDEAAAQFPALYRAWMETPTEVTFPDGESWSLVRARVVDAVAGLRRAHAGRAFAVVAHGGPLRALLAEALRLRDADIFRLDQKYGGVSIIDWLDGVPQLRLMNGGP